MLAVGNHADIALVLAQDIGQQFLAAHALEAVAAPASACRPSRPYSWRDSG